jgi:DNA-binding CsgD family transcriptional regulator
VFANERYGTRTPSQRENRVIELVAQGLKNRDVADAIGTTEHVVKNYLRVIYDKLGLWNRVELALWYESRRQEPQLPAWLASQMSWTHFKAAGWLPAAILLLTTEGLQISKSIRRGCFALSRSSIQQKTSLVATLRDAIAPQIQIRQSNSGSEISLTYRLPQPLCSFPVIAGRALIVAAQVFLRHG